MKAHTEVNGRSIHYSATGEGDPIVVVGESADHGDFGLLADWFQLLTPEWPADDPGRVATLAALIEHLDVRPVDLLGWGGAGQSALRLAIERPDLVRRLAVIGALPSCDEMPSRTRLAALATMTAPLLILQGDDEALDIAHSAALTRTVPDGRLAVLPGPSHRLPAARADLVGLILLEFFEGR